MGGHNGGSHDVPQLPVQGIESRNEAEAINRQDCTTYDPSPTLLDREAEKVDKYSRLVMVARKQHMDGKRSSLPTFAPFVVSDFGELSPAAVDLQESVQAQVQEARDSSRRMQCRGSSAAVSAQIQSGHTVCGGSGYRRDDPSSRAAVGRSRGLNNNSLKRSRLNGTSCVLARNKFYP